MWVIKEKETILGGRFLGKVKEHKQTIQQILEKMMKMMEI